MALDDWYANKFASLDSTAIYPKSGQALLYSTLDRWNEMPYKSYLCLAHSISSPFINSILQVSMQPMHKHNHEWYDPLHIITWPLWFIDLDLAHSLLLPRFIGAKSCPSFTASRSITSKPWLALHHYNQSIKSNLVLIFSTLVTWLHVMSHMQWVPSSHYMSIASTLSHFSSMAHVAHTSVFVWTNHLYIST